MFEGITKRHRPKGWRIRWSKKSNEIAERGRLKRGLKAEILDCAHADYNKKQIKSPYVVDVFTLHILLHEFGHVHLKHFTTGESHMHKEEYEADRWASEIMRMEGIAVSNEIRRSIKRYARFCVKHDERKGIEIKPHIKRFVKEKHRYV